MDIEFLEPAVEEFREAISFYNSQNSAWGMSSPRKSRRLRIVFFNIQRLGFRFPEAFGAVR